MPCLVPPISQTADGMIRLGWVGFTNQNNKIFLALVPAPDGIQFWALCSHEALDVHGTIAHDDEEGMEMLNAIAERFCA